MLSQIGLSIIAIAWLIQLVAAKKKQMLTLFAFLYIVGVIFLIIDGFLSHLFSLAFLNLATLLLAVGVMFKLAISR